jgi:hypothetical protein
MNRRSSGFLLSKALQGFENFKLASGINLATIVGYRHDLDQFLAHVGDMDVGRLTVEHVRGFLA